MSKKQEVITFKADQALREALEGIPNRSEFIRNAVLLALDSVCPVCGGSGILSACQRKHWIDFSKTHTLEECRECNEVRLVCPAMSD